MKIITLEILTTVALIIILSACSKKTTAPVVSSELRQERGERGQRGERPEFSQLLANMDVNTDGKLAKGEVKGRLLEEFATVDKNEDGFISEAEFKSGPKKQRPARRN